jgi:cell division protein FtsI (penicillin-binding protein 3)
MRHTPPVLSVRRVAVARSVLLAAFVALSARAAHLAVLDERGWDQGNRQIRTALTLPPERGTIFDRSGSELALTLQAPSVYALPVEITDANGAAAKLAPILGMRQADVAERLRGRRSFRYLSRWVSREQAAEILALSLPGVGILHEARRTYPVAGLSASLVGFANIDGDGVRGIEQQEDGWLRGQGRRLPVERDGSGHFLVSEGEAPGRTAGGDVVLTLDAAMQADASARLAEAIRETGARGGIVVSIDPASGDLLALAEAPGFDPNRFREVPYSATRSRAFLDAVEPGSALKAFLVASALERGALDPGAWIDCENGSFRVPGKTIRDLKPNGWLHPADVLRVSSNIGSVKIAMALGARDQYEMLRLFGFGESTGSGFPEESAGVLRPSQAWRPVDQATIAFGQGISVTAIQLAAATAALANGGEWMRPRLVAARRAPLGEWQSTPLESPRRVVSSETARTVIRMLEGVTGPQGTGRRAALRDLAVAGKTGTAQKLDRATGRYSNDRFVAWFIGVAPADAPRLAMVVALDEPRRPSHTGGAAAAPLFARVAAAQLARLGVQTEPAIDLPARPPAAVARPAAAPASSAPKKVASPAPPSAPRKRVVQRALPDVAAIGDRVLLPDFQGLSVAEVRQITARHGLRVEISGKGRAIAQDPPPGTVVAARGARVRVRFRAAGDEI